MPVFPRADLGALWRDAERFARSFPSIASALSRATEDPVTERLVEGVYTLAGTVLDKASDYQAHAHDALAERVCPWLRRPIPSGTVVAFEPSKARRVHVRASTPMLSAPIDGVRCTFRPLRDLVIEPYTVRDSSLVTSPGRGSVVRISIAATGDYALNDIVASGMSLYVDGELEGALEIVAALTSNVVRVTVESPQWTGLISSDPFAFERDYLEPRSSLTPDPDGRPPAFGIVTESFVFPDKFRFFRVPKLEECASLPRTASMTFCFELGDALAPSVRLAPDDVKAHCVPVANLFEASAEPLPLDFECGDVPLRVAGLPPHGGGVYAVEDARIVACRGEHPPLPLADVRRLAAAVTDERCPAVFALSTAQAGGGDPDVMIAFGTKGDAAVDDLPRLVSMRVLATNRSLAGRVRTGDLAGVLEFGSERVRFRNVTAASPYIAAPHGDALALRAVRYAKVPLGARDPRAAIKAMLLLSIPSWVGRAEWVRAQQLRVASIESVTVGVARRAAGEATERGYAYRIVVNESAFRGPGDLALFGVALGEALSRSSPVNSFAEVTLVGAKQTFSGVYPRGRRWAR
jgi:type VI secretion system protein ImpG